MFVCMREWGYERKDRVSESACMCERLSFLNQHERQLVSGCGFMHECVGERERERERYRQNVTAAKETAESRRTCLNQKTNLGIYFSLPKKLDLIKRSQKGFFETTYSRKSKKLRIL